MDLVLAGYPWCDGAKLPWAASEVMRSHTGILGRTVTFIAQRNRYRCFKVMIFKLSEEFPGGAVVKNPPANAGDTVSIPGPGRSHMLRSK